MADSPFLFRVKGEINMGCIFLFTILIVGLSGLTAQALLVRELLVSFSGNELTLGIILANWVALEALGTFIIGRWIDRAKDKVAVFVWFQILFSLMFFVSLYLSRAFKGLLGIPVGEAVSLYVIFLVSLFVLFPVSFSHGALFSISCRIYPLVRSGISSTPPQVAALSIGNIYAWETLGTMLGGVIMTYFFLPYLESLRIAFIISIINLVICFFLLKLIPKAKIKYILFVGIASLVFLSVSGGLNNLHQASINKQWRGSQVLDYRNSVYGNVVVTKEREQYTFFYNGLPVITTPYPDIQFVDEFGNLPLLFHPAPKDILIVGAGAGGLIAQMRKHAVRKIDYVELDPLIIQMLKEHPTALTESELADKRVNIKNLDGRFFMRTTPHKYDVILLGLSNPQDLSINRLFTQEFFLLAKQRLNKEGILALWLPGSLTYLGQELKDLNACILNALRASYNYVRIVPGDYNIFLSSDASGILEADAPLITQRVKERDIKDTILLPAYLDYRLSKYWLDWFRGVLRDATARVNKDSEPVAVFEMLKLNNKKFFPKLANLLGSFENLDLKKIAVFIALLTILLFFILRRAGGVVAYSILSSGFFGMLTSLILIFAYQVFFGFLYHRIGLLVSIFMAGIAAGSIFITAFVERLKNKLKVFMGLEALIIIFTYIMALTVTRLLGFLHFANTVFIALFFVSGFFLGLEFPLANKIYLGKGNDIGKTAGLLYASDLAGGWLAGLLGGIILLPVLGLFSTCLVIIIFKLSSFFLLLVAQKRLSTL